MFEMVQFWIGFELGRKTFQMYPIIGKILRFPSNARELFSLES
jgi:hypothetical protein